MQHAMGRQDVCGEFEVAGRVVQAGAPAALSAGCSHVQCMFYSCRVRASCLYTMVCKSILMCAPRVCMCLCKLQDLEKELAKYRMQEAEVSQKKSSTGSLWSYMAGTS